MSIIVTDAVRNESIAYHFTEVLDLGIIEYPLGDFIITEPVSISGSYVVMDGELFMNGSCSVSLERICDRCAERYIRRYELAFDETFTRGSEDDSSEDYTFDGEKIDLTRLIQDCIMLQIPTASLCREDCKGLCPVCGVNLNEVQCKCDRELSSSPFAMLAGLELEKEE